MGNIHLKNLSLHHAANDEEALNLLFTVSIVAHFVLLFCAISTAVYALF